MESQSPLYRFWKNIVTPTNARNKKVPSEWEEQVFCLSQHGVGIEDALCYLHEQHPGFEAFMYWLQRKDKPVIPQYDAGKILTKDDLEFWDSNGYIVIKDAVSRQQCTDACDAIWGFLGASPSDPESWYNDHPGKNGMMLRFTHHPALDTNRASAKIRQVYSDLYGETAIYLLVDKVSFNPPDGDEGKFMGSPLHWDVSLQLPIPFVLQGLLYLSDTAATDGAFHCVPGFHKTIGDWLGQLPGETNPREAAISELKPVPVPGNAGDLVIWHQALPHCATPNKGALPRMVQYIAYKPVKNVSAAVWK